MKLTLPLELAEAQLFKRGALIKLTLQLAEGRREKFCVVVNVDHALDPVLLILSTTKLEWYNNHPTATGFVRIQQGTISSLTRESVISCRELYRVPRKSISDGYAGKTVEYCEQVPPEVLALLDSSLAAAVTLSPNEKALVAPPPASK